MARVSRPVARGSRVYVLCAEPKEHQHFRPRTRLGGSGYPAGRIGDRGDREIVYVPNVYVPFPAPRKNNVAGTLAGCPRDTSPSSGLSEIYVISFLCGKGTAFSAPYNYPKNPACRTKNTMT